MPTKSGAAAWVMVTGGLFVLAGCGAGGSASLPSSSPGASSAAAAFDQRLDSLCAADVAFNRSLPGLQASQHLSVTELEAKVNAAGAAFRANVARLTPPAALAGALHALVADQASPPARPATPTAASLAALVAWQRKLAGDYTALGAAGCAANEQQAIASLECALGKSSASSTCPADPNRITIVTSATARPSP